MEDSLLASRLSQRNDTWKGHGFSNSDKQGLLNSVRSLPCFIVVNGGVADSSLGCGRESGDEMINHDDDILLCFDASQGRGGDREVPRVVFPSDAPDCNYAAVV